MQQVSDSHYQSVLAAILRGRLIPFLGAGANLCDRQCIGSEENEKDIQEIQNIRQHGPDAPSGDELAKYLLNCFQYDSVLDVSRGLTKVSQSISLLMGPGHLHEELHRVFDRDYHPTSLHAFLARLPGILRSSGFPRPYQLLLTTNYDDILERAFDSVGEPYDVLTYIAGGEQRGRFLCRKYDTSPQLVLLPNQGADISVDHRTVIMKIHGAVDRTSQERDSFVITEDDYIDYLSITELEDAVPAGVRLEFPRSSFLFLGYSLSDWNVRVFLNRIALRHPAYRQSWAVQKESDDLQKRFWQQRHVDVVDTDLKQYVLELEKRLLISEGVAKAGSK